MRIVKREGNPAESGYQLLERKGISRRDFLKMCTITCTALGLDLGLAPQIAEAAAANLSKKPLIWMQGQGCTGCSESLLASLDPSPDQIILDLLSVRYHPTLMAASGEQAVQSMEDCIAKGKYILVLEGSIPTADPRYCMVEGKSFIDQFKKAAAKAEAVIAVGSCACFGGIPRAGFTGAVGAQDVLSGVKIVNLPSCPVKPDRLVSVILYYLSENALPLLDELKRPKAYYRYTLHDSCYRRMHFEKDEFLENWNDAETTDWCLYHKGCKGQDTYTTCAASWWNDGVSFCGYAGSPCAGCSEPDFYDGFAPLFVNPKEEK
ncbi:MAG: hydrogenase small subunit [Desulfitobacterium sp.]